MTHSELSKEYALHAEALGVRICQLETELETVSDYLRESIEDRIKMLTTMREETFELSKLISGVRDLR